MTISNLLPFQSNSLTYAVMLSNNYTRLYFPTDSTILSYRRYYWEREFRLSSWFIKLTSFFRLSHVLRESLTCMSTLSYTRCCIPSRIELHSLTHTFILSLTHYFPLSHALRHTLLHRILYTLKYHYTLLETPLHSLTNTIILSKTNIPSQKTPLYPLLKHSNILFHICNRSAVVFVY